VTTAPAATPAEAFRRALLVCPPFFSYHHAIGDALRERGYEVTWWSDRAGEGFAYKLAMRLAPRVVGGWSTGHFLRKLEALPPFEVDDVLVVKGEALSRRAVRAIAERWPAAALHLYLWDGIENVPNARALAPLFESVATFDPVDAKRFGWRYRPLFSRIGLSPPDTRSDQQVDWAFVGTLHSDRHRVLQRIRRCNPELRGVILGFVPGFAMMVGRRLTDWTLTFAPRATIRTRAIQKSEVLAVTGDARAIVDVEHPRQRGLTMRTIETLLMGKKLITTNRFAVESDLYHPSRIHVISRERPEIPREFFESPFEPIPGAVAARYLLSGWLADLLQDDRAAALGAGPARAARVQAR
jgi:hypothetical protein